MDLPADAWARVARHLAVLQGAPHRGLDALRLVSRSARDGVDRSVRQLDLTVPFHHRGPYPVPAREAVLCARMSSLDHLMARMLAGGLRTVTVDWASPRQGLAVFETIEAALRDRGGGRWSVRRYAFLAGNCGGYWAWHYRDDLGGLREAVDKLPEVLRLAAYFERPVVAGRRPPPHRGPSYRPPGPAAHLASKRTASGLRYT